MSAAPRLALALETSTRPASVAACDASGAVHFRTLDAERSHASDLLVEISAAVASLGARPIDLDLVVVGTGPGSYTGLRVGAATALGLHRGARASLVGVPSFEAIARAALSQDERGLVVRNAFGGRVYVARYHRAEPGLEALVAPACVEPDAALALLEPDDVLLADDDALRALARTREEVGVDVRSTDAHARDLLPLGLERFEREGDGGPRAVRPLYLRPFEAKVRRR